MRYLLGAALAVLLCGTCNPALAQLNNGGVGGPAGGGPAPQPRAVTPDIAPPALPGAGGVPLLSSAPAAQKPATGDPTTALFAAINSNNYNGAQDAISRGADLTQQNTLGETPLDLSVALNRNSITFMLLGARNESAQAGGGAPMALPASAAAPQTHHHHKPLVQTTTPTATMAPAVPLNDPGTPNPQAGFLGFDTGK